MHRWAAPPERAVTWCERSSAWNYQESRQQCKKALQSPGGCMPEAMPLGSMNAQSCDCIWRLSSTLTAVQQSY